MLVGGSYIATEVAATLTALGRKVRDRDAGGGDTRARLRPAVGRFFQSVLDEHGVEVYGGEDIERFEGARPCAAVVTKKGTAFPPTP